MNKQHGLATSEGYGEHESEAETNLRVFHVEACKKDPIQVRSYKQHRQKG